MARPRAGDWLEDEIEAWRAQDVALVLSLLEREEVVDLGLEREPSLCARVGIEFRSFPIPDRGTPSNLDAAAAECRLINDQLARGNKVAIHCRAGIGRSSLIAACALGFGGSSARDAFALIGRARGLDVPDTPDQLRWVEDFLERASKR